VFLFAFGGSHCRLLDQGLFVGGGILEVLLAAQGLLKMTSQLEPLRFRSWGKGAERTNNPVAWTALGSYRFNQQMIGVSLTAERSLGALDEHWCLYNKAQAGKSRK
jgi:hypothetical protein